MWILPYYLKAAVYSFNILFLFQVWHAELHLQDQITWTKIKIVSVSIYDPTILRCQLTKKLNTKYVEVEKKKRPNLQANYVALCKLYDWHKLFTILSVTE